ncbi:sulfite exporter TauE/SafE family protein [Vibrio sp.]|uniref:sulfite exporter TauE/SafE family protein n=1 Tax=Vibrio sp. TaxID=678 RepID=UPI003D09E3BF
MVTPDFIGAFVIGLLGAGHCMAMCGGLSSLLTIGSPSAHPMSHTLLLYNAGRIISYMVFGALIGGFTASISQLASLNQSLIWLRLLAAMFMVILGLYIGRWWFGLLKLEAVGQKLWYYLSPLGRHFLPLTSRWQAIPFGFIWGWLPCGLVYSILTWAAVSGSAISGALIMGAFGMGTLPAMLAIGASATKLKHIQQSKYFRQLAALSIIAYGFYTVYGAVEILLALS